MSVGPIPMRPSIGWVLTIALAGPVAAKPADCPGLAAALEGLTGYQVAAPPAGPEGGWCVFDRAVLVSEAAPGLQAERLRLRGDMAEGALVELAVTTGGVRVAPGPGQRDMDPTLRETLRLQTAELAFVLTLRPEGLALREGRLKLSGGTELDVEADVAGAGLSAGSLILGRLTRVVVDWRNDGKLLRPVMQSWGESLVDGALGERGVDAARLSLQHKILNLPDLMFQEGGKDLLDKVLDALPQGRGRLWLEFASAEGIGLADVAIAVFSGDPYGAEAQAQLFDGSQLSFDWQPGLAP